MKSQSPLLVRLWRKLFSGEALPATRVAPVKLEASRRRPLPREARSSERGIEPLEGRIAPAVLLPGGRDVSYTDVDNDHVTIHFSKPIFLPAPGGSVDTILASVFTFSTGSIHAGEQMSNTDGPQLLQTIDLTKIRPNGAATPATGVSFTITAVRPDATHGDGLANVGSIIANNISLGSIVVPGDLGQIDAGTPLAAVGVQALTVKSLGARVDTQTGTPNYESTIVGHLGRFTADTVVGGYLHVTNGVNAAGKSPAIGSIGAVDVTQYIKARDVSASATNDGLIQAADDIGTLLVGSGHRDAAHLDLSDGLNGGSGTNSGAVIAGGQIGKIAIKGDLRGGAGSGSASLSATGQIGSLLVEGSLNGSGAKSADITSSTKIGAVSIGTAGGPGLVGGADDGSAVLSSGGSIGSITISNLQGLGPNTAGITAAGAIGNVTVGGSITGGGSAHSGFLESQTSLGAVKLAGSLQAGAGTGSAVVSSAGAIASFSALNIVGDTANSGGVSAIGKIGSIKLAGSLTGGASQHSGFIDSNTELGNVTILGNIEGGLGVKSGTILSAGKIGLVTITGHVKGGSATVIPQTPTTPGSSSGGDLSGSITSGASGVGGITSVAIGGGLTGGTAIDSGVISSGGSIGSVTLKNSSITGGAGDGSGSIFAYGNIGTVSIGHDLSGSFGQFSGTIREHGVLRSVTIGGTLGGGVGDDAGALLALDSGTPGGVHAAGGLGTVVVKGLIVGGQGERSGVISSDGAIQSLSTAGLDSGTKASAGRIVSGAGLYAAGDIGTLNLGISGSLTNGTGTAGGTVLAYGSVKVIEAIRLEGTAIHVLDSIGQFLVGNSDGESMRGVTVTAGGQAIFNGKTDLAIGQIYTLGNISTTSFLAGYGMFGEAENGHAQVGTVQVHGSWTSSNLVAGVQDAGAPGFGDAQDTLIAGNTSAVKARIARIAITGNVDGAVGTQSGFVAQEIGAFNAANAHAALTSAPGQDFNFTGETGGTISVREVAPASGATS